MKGETQGLKVREQVPMSWNPGRIRHSQPSEGPFERSLAQSLVENDCTQPSNTTGFCVPTAGPDTQEDLSVLMVRAEENLERWLCGVLLHSKPHLSGPHYSHSLLLLVVPGHWGTGRGESQASPGEAPGPAGNRMRAKWHGH